MKKATKRNRRKACKARRREMKNLVFWLGSGDPEHEIRALMRLMQYNGKIDWALRAAQKIAVEREQAIVSNSHPWAAYTVANEAAVLAKQLIKKITGPAYNALTESL